MEEIMGNNEIRRQTLPQLTATSERRASLKLVA